jgi:hypothetical protein
MGRLNAAAVVLAKQTRLGMDVEMVTVIHGNLSCKLFWKSATVSDDPNLERATSITARSTFPGEAGDSYSRPSIRSDAAHRSPKICVGTGLDGRDRKLKASSEELV